jgi:hypothetical protein
VRSARCFQTKGYKVGDRGLHSVTDQPTPDASISLPRWLAHSDAVARRVADAGLALRDAALFDYFKTRKSHGEVIHRFYGSPGLTMARTHYDTPAHQAAVTFLRERLTDPGFGSGLSPLERAELELLAADPLEFVSCTARRGQRSSSRTSASEAVAGACAGSLTWSLGAPVCVVSAGGAHGYTTRLPIAVRSGEARLRSEVSA